MYELTLPQTATLAQVIDRVGANIGQVETVIYRADDWFQAHIVPTVERWAISTFIAFIRGAYLAFIAGQDTREWFDAWFAGYCLNAVPIIHESYGMIRDEPLLIAAPSAPIALLMPAAPTVIELPGQVEAPKAKLTRKPKTETKGKPAPKSRKPAGIAPRKAPTTVIWKVLG